MAEYRCIAADLRTGARITELPLSGLSFGARLNDVGQASGTLPLPAPNSATNRALATLLNDAVDEARRMLIIERDGVIVWSGIIWVAGYSDSDQSRDVRASDEGSYSDVYGTAGNVNARPLRTTHRRRRNRGTSKSRRRFRIRLVVRMEYRRHRRQNVNAFVPASRP